MKYAIGMLAIIFTLTLLGEDRVKDPDGPYADGQGAMALWFYNSGRLAIMASGGSSMKLNGRGWDGPTADRVTNAIWARKGSKIYIVLPGESKAIPALTIDGDDILMDNIRFKKVDISKLKVP